MTKTILTALILLLGSTSEAWSRDWTSCDAEYFDVLVEAYETETDFVQKLGVGCRGAVHEEYVFIARHPIVDGEVKIDEARSLRFRTLTASALALQHLPWGTQITISRIANPQTAILELYSVRTYSFFD